MYSIMLVDDDPIVLVELKKMIEWKELDCELIAEAGSGKSAVELLREYRPDIVFTDISMPHMSGVELINYINELDEGIKVVALSAYEDFDYVRGSLKNGAKDYLLKHQMTKESINELIKTMIQDIGTEQREKAPSFKESREELLYTIVHEHLEPENEKVSLSRMKLSWMLKDMIAVVGGIDSYFVKGREVKTDELTMRILIDETIKYYRDYFMMPLNPGIFVIVFSAAEKSGQDVEEVILQIQSTLCRFCDLELSFTVSDPFTGIETIRKQIQIIKAALLENYFQGKEKFIIHGERVEEAVGILEEERLFQMNETLYLKEHNVKEYFEELFREIGNRHLSRGQVHVFYMEVVMFLRRKMNDLQLEECTVFDEVQPYETGTVFGTSEEIKKSLICSCVKMQKELKRKGYSFAKHSISEQAMKYVEENYSRKITLSEVAQKLVVSSAYLSRTFKKSMGINLVAYINKVKMKHAQEMILQGNMTLQEIACEIGIENYNYFYLLFKEVYGISPSDYIKSIGQEEKQRGQNTEKTGACN